MTCYNAKSDKKLEEAEAMGVAQKGSWRAAKVGQKFRRWQIPT